MGKWYLEPVGKEYDTWLPQAMHRENKDTLNGVTLPAAEPASAVHGDGWNILPLTDNGPTLQPGQIVASRSVTHDGTTATVSYTVQDKPLDAYKAERKAALASIRYDHEISGTTINGTFVNTDRDTQSKLIAARILAKEDPAYTIRWKLPTGFTTLDAATLIAIADGVRAHVQAAFDREDVLTQAINAATTHADLDAIDINAGWPG